MLVRFKTVRTDAKEVYEREIQKELEGSIGMPFEYQYDYVSDVVIELDEVTGYVSGKVWVNDEERDCVYLKMGKDFHPQNILIEPDKFRKVFERCRRQKIANFEDLLS